MNRLGLLIETELAAAHAAMDAKEAELDRYGYGGQQAALDAERAAWHGVRTELYAAVLVAMGVL